MLEHLPPAIRQNAVDELVRIAGHLLVIAVPSGHAAERHDAAMARLFRMVRGADFRYLREHVDNGLPTPAELEACIRRAVERALTWASPLLTRIHGGVPYRWIADVRFS